MKRMRLDNLIAIFFNQAHVLTTSVEKKTNPNKSRLIRFDLEENSKSLVWKQNVKAKDRNGKVTVYTS